MNNPSPDDILQGQLGNCYFLSVISAISGYPNLLNRIFETKNKNYSGIYCLNFYIDGEKKKIIVDDYIPVYKYDDEPLFCRLNKTTKSFWPIILEKAWAKLLGSYQKTSGGYPSYPFDVLLGYPCEEYCLETELNKLDNFDSLNISPNPENFIEISENVNFLVWEKLLSSFHNNYLISCSTNDNFEKSSSLNKEIEELGLVSRHAYTCLFFQEFQIENGQIIKLVKLRNPWGKTKSSKFKGSLIKNNYYNNEEIRLNTFVAGEGDFILEFDEFKKYFSLIYICKIKNNYIYYNDIIYNENFEEKINLNFNQTINKSKL